MWWSAEVNYGGADGGGDPADRGPLRAVPRGGGDAGQKRLRAEPVAALYEQGKRAPRRALLPGLEDELCNWVEGEPSPGRLDALVWCVTELLVKEQKELVIY
jgi:phage terminase large subunit-like protein